MSYSPRDSPRGCFPLSSLQVTHHWALGKAEVWASAQCCTAREITVRQRHRHSAIRRAAESLRAQQLLHVMSGGVVKGGLLPCQNPVSKAKRKNTTTQTTKEKEEKKAPLQNGHFLGHFLSSKLFSALESAPKANSSSAICRCLGLSKRGLRKLQGQKPVRGKQSTSGEFVEMVRFGLLFDSYYSYYSPPDESKVKIA